MLNKPKTKYMNCSNCNATISCGCQKRMASDGAQVCASCIDAYEAKLAAARN